MKNKFLVILTIIASGLLGSSCNDDFLDKMPLGTLSSDVLGNAEGLRGAMVGAYAPLNDGGNEGGIYGWVLGDQRGGDLTKGSDPGDQPHLVYYSTFEYVPASDGISGNWSQNYKGANRCNSVLSLIKTIPDEEVSAEQKTLYEAELKFLRAHYYFQLKLNYDVVPWVDEETEDARVPNTVDNDGVTFVDIWPHIYADMEFAALNLPDTQTDVARPNKWAAKAYLAKIYMYASELPSASGVSYDKFSDALDLVDEVIADGVNSSGEAYGLMDGYFDNFQPDTENGKESVWSVQLTLNDGTLTSGWGDDVMPNSLGNIFIGPQTPYASQITGMPGFGFFQPTPWLANHYRVDSEGIPYWDMYEQGNDITYGGSVDLVKDDYTLTAYDDYEVDTEMPLDPRIDWVMGRRGIPYLGYESDGEPGMNGSWIRNPQYGGPYLIKKWFTEADLLENSQYYVNGQRNVAMNVNVIRYAEVLLWKAELEVRVNGDFDMARQYVNMVRQRMIDNQNDPRNRVQDSPANYQIETYPAGHEAFTSEENALLAICMEFGLEFANEGKRFYDLTRFNYGEKALNQSLGFLVDYGFTWFDEGYIKYTESTDRYLPISTANITSSIKDGVTTLTNAYY